MDKNLLGRCRRQGAKEIIKQILEAFDFVNWDRFTVDNENNPVWFDFYGWIDREKDSYKDFVHLTYKASDNLWGAITSSDKYSKKIAILLGYSLQEHSDCIRVENHFDIKNSIKLSCKKSQK